jgi:hypothetical protein
MIIDYNVQDLPSAPLCSDIVIENCLFTHRVLPATGCIEVWTTDDDISPQLIKNFINNDCRITLGKNCYDGRLKQYKYVITAPWKGDYSYAFRYSQYQPEDLIKFGVKYD